MSRATARHSKSIFPERDGCGDQRAAEPSTAAPGGKETILVTEDEPLVRSLAVRILAKAGYTVLAADDGAEAWRIFQDRGKNISLVLLDTILPKLSGRERLLPASRPRLSASQGPFRRGL